MSRAADEAALIEARRLRDLARTVVRTDLQTLRLSLTERPLARRAQDRLVATAVDTAESGLELARENGVVLALTAASLVAWLFRKRLGALAQAGWIRAASLAVRVRG